MIIEVEICKNDGTTEVISFNLKKHINDLTLTLYYFEDGSFNELVWKAIKKEGDAKFGPTNWDSYSLNKIRWE